MYAVCSDTDWITSRSASAVCSTMTAMRSAPIATTTAGCTPSYQSAPTSAAPCARTRPTPPGTATATAPASPPPAKSSTAPQPHPSKPLTNKRSLGQFASGDEFFGDVAEFAVGLLGVALEDLEGAVAVETVALHQDAHRLTDQLAGVDRQHQGGLLAGVGDRDRRVA